MKSRLSQVLNIRICIEWMTHFSVTTKSAHRAHLIRCSEPIMVIRLLGYVKDGRLAQNSKDIESRSMSMD